MSAEKEARPRYWRVILYIEGGNVGPILDSIPDDPRILMYGVEPTIWEPTEKKVKPHD